MMLLKKSSILIALFFLLVLAGKSMASSLQHFNAADPQAETEWLLDLEREQESRENRGTETSPLEEVFERTGFLQYQLFAPPSFSSFAKKAVPLPDVFIDNTTPPPNFC